MRWVRWRLRLGWLRNRVRHHRWLEDLADRADLPPAVARQAHDPALAVERARMIRRRDAVERGRWRP